MRKTVLMLFTLIVSVAFIVSCTDADGARKTLERSGYKDIEIGGYDYLGGSEEDIYKTRFEATAPNGERVTGTVTRGAWKGNTVRLD